MTRAAEWLRWKKNSVDYALRSRLSFSQAYEERNESKANMFEDEDFSGCHGELATLEQSLRERYNLHDVYRHSTVARYREVLEYLNWLDVLRQNAGFTLPPSQSPCYWLDVGSKNWSYVPALYQTLAENSRTNFRLDGIEIDPYRRYTDGKSRADYARAYTRHYPRAHYHFADSLSWAGNFNQSDPGFYHVITHFLPFVLSEPCQDWGLPRRFFQPSEQLTHLSSLLLPGGQMLIVNQGEWEHKAQAALLQELAEKSSIYNTTLVVKWSGEMPVKFSPYRYPRYGWLLEKRIG